MVTSDSMFATTPTANGRTDSGRRSMSGCSRRFWRRTNSARNAAPTTTAAAATAMLPENAVDTPYMSPMSAMPTSATEGASSLGCVSFATSPSMTAPNTRHAAVSTANTAMSMCQSNAARSTPATMTDSEGPSVVMAPMMPM